MAKSRTASPPPAKNRGGSNGKAEAGGDSGAASSKKGAADETAPEMLAPPRPEGLRGSLLQLHLALAASVLLFALLGHSMLNPVPKGQFRMKDGRLVDVNDFDPVELGPYPMCHPHHGEHERELENGTRAWVKNTEAPNGGPYPPGHPENPEWQEKAHKETVRLNLESRFTWAGLQPNLHLLALALLCVYLGSKHSVWLFTEPPETREVSQLLQKEDAAWFPVMGSCVLFGLFVVLKYMGTDFIKLAISCGIVMMSIFAVGTNLDHLAILILRKSRFTEPVMMIPILEQYVTMVELLGMVIGGLMAVGFMFTKNWIINNVFGVSFCLVGIKLIGISSYKTGTIMLVGLFFYDIFWVFGSKPVFGSNVMVSVAKGVEGPIKLMFPRSLSGCGILQHSMLGLGDIVVPGIFIAFLAKWDATRMGEKKANSFVYLNTTMVAYALSLVTTVAIMLFFNAAQPALLYIVPYVLIASMAVAVSRGEFKELWDYVIEDELLEEEEPPAGEAAASGEAEGTKEGGEASKKKD